MRTTTQVACQEDCDYLINKEVKRRQIPGDSLKLTTTRGVQFRSAQ